MRGMRIRSRARHTLAWVLSLLLVAGLMPVLPEVPRALAEETDAIVLDGGGTEIRAAEDEAAYLRGDANTEGMDELSDADPLVTGAQGEDIVLDEEAEDVLSDQLEFVTNEDAMTVEGSVLEAQSVSVSNPRVRADSSMKSGQVATWDCVWFGSYPQTEVAPTDAAYASLQSASWDANGDATVGGKRYCRISKSDATYDGYWSDDGYGSAAWRYFRYEPIKWRVLKVSGSTALVVADVALDYQWYNADFVDVTWETSGIRSWLNGYAASFNQPGTDFSRKNFVDAAFFASEWSAILTTDVVNADNTYNGTAGGNNTKDKVFLLSEAEVYDASHGFASRYNTKDEARRCKMSDYARAMGAYRYSGGSYDGNCYWWLRSPGCTADGAADVEHDGSVSRDGGYVGTEGAVRPALNLNLASSYPQAAGTVSSNGDVDEQAPSCKDIPSVTLGTTTYTFDGTAKKPTVNVRVGDEVVPESGYEVSYKYNVNVGIATVTVTCKGDYEGTAKAAFKIVAASVAKATVTGVKGKTYTGKKLTQSLKVVVGGRTLKKGTDYALSYKSNVKAGTATMTITGKGNYKGSKSVKFKIAKAANPMAVKAVARTAKLATVKKKAVTVAAPLKFTKKAQGKVTYAKVAKGSSAVLTVNKTTGKVTVKKGTKKGTYKVKVKVTAAGNANYKALSKTITCKVVVK